MAIIAHGQTCKINKANLLHGSLTPSRLIHLQSWRKLQRSISLVNTDTDSLGDCAMQQWSSVCKEPCCPKNPKSCQNYYCYSYTWSVHIFPWTCINGSNIQSEKKSQTSTLEPCSYAAGTKQEKKSICHQAIEVAVNIQLITNSLTQNCTGYIHKMHQTYKCNSYHSHSPVPTHKTNQATCGCDATLYLKATVFTIR